MNARFLVAAIVLTIAPIGLAACASTYYLIKDPHDGREYYTTKFHRSGGAISFKDDKTQSAVTLESSEIIEISKDQYRADTGAR